MVLVEVFFQARDVTCRSRLATWFERQLHVAGDNPGLVRSYFSTSDDAERVSGIHLWDSRTQAEAFYDERWAADFAEYLGVTPTLRWSDCMGVVDHRHSEILAGATH
jgi:hypothetical protein